jgi:hypothetical protein
MSVIPLSRFSLGPLRRDGLVLGYGSYDLSQIGPRSRRCRERREVSGRQGGNARAGGDLTATTPRLQHATISSIAAAFAQPAHGLKIDKLNGLLGLLKMAVVRPTLPTSTEIDGMHGHAAPDVAPHDNLRRVHDTKT